MLGVKNGYAGRWRLIIFAKEVSFYMSDLPYNVKCFSFNEGVGFKFSVAKEN